MKVLSKVAFLNVLVVLPSAFGVSMMLAKRIS